MEKLANTATAALYERDGLQKRLKINDKQKQALEDLANTNEKIKRVQGKVKKAGERVAELVANLTKRSEKLACGRFPVANRRGYWQRAYQIG